MMAVAEAAAPVNPERAIPPPIDLGEPNRLSANLSSNNPFRNRSSAASPSSPRSANATQQHFPFPNEAISMSKSNNPFLDPGEPIGNKSAVNGSSTTEAEGAFKDLSLLDKPNFSAPMPPRGPQQGNPGQAPSQHRPFGPGERRDRPPPRGPPRDPNSPQKRPDHRRRASESSMMDEQKRDRRERDRSDRPPRTESEERRRRERRKEREERHQQEKERLKNGGKPRKPQRNLDIIDKLDVTGIYGQGLFHHDGPFDACNPHRNAKKDRRAPMQAFPEGSANMALGGSGPNNSRLDLDRFHGRTEEGFSDYSYTRRTNNAELPPRIDRSQPLQYVNPTDRIEQVHGEESYGLGTSTFLEGAPASKSALQRRESEDDGGFGGGLQRKKSLAQRIRGMSNTRPTRPGPEGLRSPDPRYAEMPAERSPTLQQKALSAGGPARATNFTKENEINPFDNDYDKAFEKKGTQIRIAEQERPNVGRARAPSSPNDGGLITRSVTADAASPTEEKPMAGFLNRMKSLKGSRRARPERKESSTAV